MWKIALAVVVVLGLACAGVAGGLGYWWWARQAAAVEQETTRREMRQQEAVMAAEIEKQAATREEADARYAAEDWSGAIDLYDAVLETSPDDLGALLGRARSFAHVGRDERAAEDLEAILKVDPRHVEALDTLAWVQSHQGYDRDALQTLDKLLAVDESRAKSWRDRANIRFRLGDRENALADARRSCQLGLSEGCAMEQRIREASR